MAKPSKPVPKPKEIPKGKPPAFGPPAKGGKVPPMKGGKKC